MKNLFENKYNDTVTALENLALQLTGKTKKEIITTAVEQGEAGLLRLISENLKDFVSREEMEAAISTAVAAAMEAHLAAKHTTDETPAAE